MTRTTKLPRLSEKEFIILNLLISQGEMFGLEMVKSCPRDLKRGTVYTTLFRMAKKGFVESHQYKDDGAPGMPRRVFKATGLGRRVYAAFRAQGFGQLVGQPV